MAQSRWRRAWLRWVAPHKRSSAVEAAAWRRSQIQWTKRTTQVRRVVRTPNPGRESLQRIKQIFVRRNKKNYKLQLHKLDSKRRHCIELILILSTLGVEQQPRPNGAPLQVMVGEQPPTTQNAKADVSCHGNCRPRYRSRLSKNIFNV